MSSLRGEPHDYTSGPLSRAILLLAVPMVLEMSMEALFALCDMIYLTQIDESIREASIATVGLTESMLTIVFAIAIGFAMAVTATVARKIGEKDDAGANLAAMQGVLVGVVIGAAIGIAAGLNPENLLSAMGAKQEVIELGSSYASIIFGTNVVILLLFINNAIFRGAGDAVLALKTLLLANGINILLDPCLIFGLGPFPEMGVTGAAVASTIGRSIGVAYQFWALRRGAGRIQLRGACFRADLPMAKHMLKISIGGIAQFLIATASWVALIRIVSNFGTDAVAGYQVAVRIAMFVILPAWGLSNAAATLVGQNLGARKPDRAERSVWITGSYNMAFLVAVSVLLVTFADEIVGLLLEKEQAAAVAADCLRVFSYGYIAFAWGMVMVQAFNGAGCTMIPTRINIVAFWMIEIPLAWWLAMELEWGPIGVFWSVPIAEAVMTIIAIVVFRRGSWKVLSPGEAEAPA